jgi:gamma-glutamylcysteine synthetase
MELNLNLPDAKKLGVLRTHPQEILIAFLIFVIFVLAAWVYRIDVKTDTVNAEIKKYLYEDRKTTINAINENTESNKEILESNRQVVEGLNRVTTALNKNNDIFKTPE